MHKLELCSIQSIASDVAAKTGGRVLVVMDNMHVLRYHNH